MAGNIQWQSGPVQSMALQVSGAGQAVTNGNIAACSGPDLGILNNAGVSGFGFFAIAELLCAQSGFGAAVNFQTTIDLYLLPSRDGTNYPTIDSTNNNLPFGSLKGSFALVQSGNYQARINIEGIPLMPVKYKGYIKNNAGQTLQSGWGLTIDLYTEGYT